MRWMGISKKQFNDAGVSPGEENVSAYFGCTFSVDTLPQVLEVHIGALNQYKLWINGECLLSGPCRGDRLRAYYDTIDLAPYVHKADNFLVIQVLSYPSKPRDKKYKGPTYCYCCDDGPMLAVENSNEEFDFSDVEKWEVHIDTAMDWASGTMAGAAECVYGEKVIYRPYVNPQLPKSIHFAVDRGEAFYNAYGEIKYPVLKERPIPLMYRKKAVFQNGEAVAIKANSLVRFVLDAGRITTAYFRLRMKGGRGGKVRMAYAESYVHLDENGKPHKDIRDDASGVIRGYADEYFPSGREEIYEPFLFRTFRFVEVTVETVDEEMVVEPLEYIETAYPMEQKASIKSSEQWIEKIWKISVNTLQNCMHDTYEDCPYYEQLQYVMDTRLEILFTYMLSGDTRLAKKAIEDFYCSRIQDGLLQSRYPSNALQVIPGFSLYWILMLEDYYIQTGDIFFLRKYIPTAEGIAEAFYCKLGTDGMVAPMGYWDFADWTRQWDGDKGRPTALKYGASTLHNLLYVYALQSLSRMLKILNRFDSSEEYQKSAERIMSAVETLCYDAERGMYREGADFKQFSQHTQVWAVLTGLAKEDKAKEILKHAICDEDVVKCSFVMQFYLFRALEKAGIYEMTMPLWKAWQQLLELNCTTVPEKPYHPRSDCHGWGALPLYEFTAKLLGVEPLTAGWQAIKVSPKIHLIDNLSGRVPTPYGTVFLQWKHCEGTIRLSAKVPVGVKVVLYLPDDSSEEIANGYLEKIIKNTDL